MRLLTNAFLIGALTACIGGDPDTDTDTDTDTGLVTYETCAELEPAFEAETQAIRSCTQPSDCGQQLTGTSCGCTRDWVARSDADTTAFYDLMDQGNSMSCELGTFSTCDCPSASGFTCSTDGICVWDYDGAN